MPRTVPGPNLSALSKYYTWRDVLALYGGDEDTFIDAYCDGTLPLEVRRTIDEQLSAGQLQVWLLRRVVRLLKASDL